MRHLWAIFVWLGPGIAFVLADGGTVQLSQRQGAYQVTVFTQPTPCRAGPLDVSVLLQDAVTGRPISDAQVTVTAIANGTPITARATAGTATNKLLYEAILDLPAPGRWRFEVAIDGRQGASSVAFELEALDPLPAWWTFAGWIGWPALAVALFAVHQLLARRRTTAML